jgi:site-specific DNA-methyltransferase (adenine-specific)
LNRVSNCILEGENLAVLRSLPDASVELIYIDPPFNTGVTQRRSRMRTVRDVDGDRTGFGGNRYRTEKLNSAPIYTDMFDDYIGFLRPRMIEARRVLTGTGSLFVHIDPREVHYVKVMLDQVFALDEGAGRACFQNEIIWAYDYGARSTKRWPAKHDNILWYSKDPANYTFNLNATDRIPYMAPGLVGPEKAGYPTQKPLGILERIVRVHSNPGDTVLDFFAGSGTTGLAAARNGRKYILVDENPEAVALMTKRLADEVRPTS